MSTISPIKSIENKHDVYRGKDCMKTFFESLRDRAMKIMNFFKKIKLLTKEQQESYKNAKICYIYKEKFENKYVKDKKYCKVRDHCHYTGEYRDTAHSICNLTYSDSNEIRTHNQLVHKRTLNHLAKLAIKLSSVKHHYLKKKLFTITLIWKILLM